MILICVIVAPVPSMPPVPETTEEKEQMITAINGSTLFYSPAIQGYVSID